METISVKNPATGQVASFSVTGDNDPRLAILNQRIARGELEKVTASTKSRRPRQVVEDIHTGVRDEKGDLLKSVHGGGLDPDAAGDALGRPSGSGLSEAEAAKSAKVAQDAVAKQVENAEDSGDQVSPTAVAAADAAGPQKQPKKSKK